MSVSEEKLFLVLRFRPEPDKATEIAVATATDSKDSQETETKANVDVDDNLIIADNKINTSEMKTSRYEHCTCSANGNTKALESFGSGGTMTMVACPKHGIEQAKPIPVKKIKSNIYGFGSL